MLPKDNSRITLCAYSDYLEENNQIERAEEIREDLVNKGMFWFYEIRNYETGAGLEYSEGAGSGGLSYNNVGCHGLFSNTHHVGSHSRVGCATVGGRGVGGY